MNRVELELINLNFYFQSTPLLKDINFKFSSPGMYVLWGDSGVGKSTLLKIIAGFPEQRQFSDGDVILNGNPYLKPGRNIFYVQQEDELFDWMKISEHLQYFIKLGADPSACSELLEKFELDKAANLYPFQLSFGMKRRMSLLRAMVFKPKVLLLDEILSSLNAELRISSLNVIKQFIEKNQSICILVSHYPEEFKSHADFKFLQLSNFQLHVS